LLRYAKIKKKLVKLFVQLSSIINLFVNSRKKIEYLVQKMREKEQFITITNKHIKHDKSIKKLS